MAFYYVVPGSGYAAEFTVPTGTMDKEDMIKHAIEVQTAAKAGTPLLSAGDVDRY